MTFGLRNKEKNKVELERTLVGEEIGLDERVNVTTRGNAASRRDRYGGGVLDREEVEGKYLPSSCTTVTSVPVSCTVDAH